jgi:hypothetical protein
MDSRKFVLKQTAMIAIGQAICVAAMIGIFALLGQFNMAVLWGGLVGGILAILNFLFMAVGAMIAADKAEKQDVKGGQATIRTSMLVRLMLMALVLVAFSVSGICNPLAMVLPLAFTRPILTLADFFGKAGGDQK